MSQAQCLSAKNRQTQDRCAYSQNRASRSHYLQHSKLELLGVNWDFEAIIRIKRPEICCDEARGGGGGGRMERRKMVLEKLQKGEEVGMGREWKFPFEWDLVKLCKRKMWIGSFSSPTFIQFFYFSLSSQINIQGQVILWMHNFQNCPQKLVDMDMRCRNIITSIKICPFSQLIQWVFIHSETSEQKTFVSSFADPLNSFFVPFICPSFSFPKSFFIILVLMRAVSFLPSSLFLNDPSVVFFLQSVILSAQ